MKMMKLSTKLLIALVVILLGLLLTQAIVSSNKIEEERAKQGLIETPGGENTIQ